MLAVMMLLVLAINGGLFTGTIMYSALKTAEHDKTQSYIAALWPAA